MLTDQLAVDIVWPLEATAAVATFGRFFLRWRHSSLQWDDFFNSLALASLTIFSATWHASILTGDAIVYLKMRTAIYLSTWTTVYLVKASFLALCWTVFNVSTRFRRCWFGVTVYTFLSFWPCFISEFLHCGRIQDYANPDACAAIQSSGGGETLVFPSIDMALSVSSDLLILALPLLFIHNLQMSKIQKLSVAGVFAIVAIDILVEVAQCIGAFLASFDTYAEVENLMGIIRPGLTVIACSLPAYRALMPNPKPEPLLQPEPVFIRVLRNSEEENLVAPWETQTVFWRTPDIKSGRRKPKQTRGV